MRDRFMIAAVISAVISTIEFASFLLIDRTLSTDPIGTLADKIVLYLILLVVVLVVFFLFYFQEWRHRLATLAETSAMYLAGRIGNKPAIQGCDDIGKTAENLFLLAQQIKEQAKVMQAEASFTIAKEERLRIARELHDRVSQDLFGLSMLSRAMVQVEERRQGGMLENLREIDHLIMRTQANLRSLLLELRPAELRDKSLVPALQSLIEELKERTHMSIDLFVSSLAQEPTDAAIEQSLFMIAQQAIINALRHAMASAIHVRLDREQTRLVLVVRDDGIGMKKKKSEMTGAGLASMQERAIAIGGTCYFQEAIGGGTEVLVIVPCTQEATVKGESTP